jgi:hypothetical protein
MIKSTEEFTDILNKLLFLLQKGVLTKAQYHNAFQNAVDDFTSQIWKN